MLYSFIQRNNNNMYVNRYGFLKHMGNGYYDGLIGKNWIKKASMTLTFKLEVYT